MKLISSYQGLIFLIIITIIQCQNEERNSEIKKKDVVENSHNVLQNGRIISKPVVQPIPVDQRPITELQRDDINQNKPKYIANGDILTRIEDIEHPDSKRFKRKIVAETNFNGASNRWPRGVVPYEFNNGLDSRVQQNVLVAIQHWHQRTCIRFEPYNRQRHWDIGARIIIDDSGSGCATYVGYQSSYYVYLPLVCPLGSAIHELGHVIGFYHEMARTDRDLEINLYFNLMSRSEATQYDIMPNPMPGYYGQPYDLGSIMHYYPTGVMSARDNRRAFLMGQRSGLSFLDAKLANLGYHCSDDCDQKPKCENEGYVNQYCQCSCPDGFYGDQCHLLQGYLSTTRLLPTDVEFTSTKATEKPKSKASTPSTTTSTTTPASSTTAGVHWLEWSDWSNCSESCGSGIRVRTRLCSSTTIDGSSDPCSSVGGESFEIEACQNPECKQTDILMSCTFDLPNEKCPLQNNNNWQIREPTQGDQIRPVNDHTRGDGKYLIIIGNTTQTDTSQQFQLGPFIHLDSSEIKHHCLQFWYAAHGHGLGKITIVHNATDAHQNDDSFIFHSGEQSTIWKQIQQTISNDDDYEVIFAYEPITAEYNHIAIDDISIINGACPSNKQRRRKRRQIATGCSKIIDLTTTRSIETITSPNYPNLYPTNVECYYYIRAPPSYRVILQFTDFNIPTSDQNNCYDTIEIRFYHLGQPGPAYCGSGANTNNLRFTSTKNYLMIIFRSDQNYVGRGFRAQAGLTQ